MRIETLRLLNFRSFADSGEIAFGQVNIFIGQNNSGKSAILRAIRLFQIGTNAEPADARIGEPNFEIQLVLSGGGNHPIGPEGNGARTRISHAAGGQGGVMISTTLKNGAVNSHGQYSNVEPNNLIYQYLSKRKVAGFARNITETTTTMIEPDLRNLVSRVSRLANPSSPSHGEYMEACSSIIGFPFTEFASGGGQQAGLVVDNFRNIPMENMGDGVASIVGLLVDLCVADDKVFVIEEPENDLHPRALKKLLDLITDKAINNQFVVSTHSHIVVRHLGALSGAKVFLVSQDPKCRHRSRRYHDYLTIQ